MLFRTVSGNASLLADAPAITRLATETAGSPETTAGVFLSIGSDLRLSDLKAKAATLVAADEFDTLAIGQAVQQFNTAQAGFTRAALAAAKTAGGHAAWLAAHTERLAPVRLLLDQITAAETVTVSRLIVAATRLRDLADTANTPGV
jgi:NAD-specific glutamate dehydrogenase